MNIKDIKEPGFYRAVTDEVPNIIYEVIKNTDETWLKEEPNAKLIIDTWDFDHYDADDRRVYETYEGTLRDPKYMPDIDVEKMEETFTVSGNMGTTLTENKLTYKEKYNNLIEQIKKDLKKYDNFDSNYELIPSDVICDLRDYLRMSDELEKFDQEN